MKKINANDLISYLNDLFPQNSAAPWDKVGFQVEEVYNLESQDEIANIVVCLDVTNDVVEHAIKNKSNFIICRHPLLFDEKEVELENPAKKIMYEKLVENEIQVFSIHTNYDASKHQNIIELLNDEMNVKEVTKIGENEEGFAIKLFGDLTIDELTSKLKKVFNTEEAKISNNTDFEKLVDKFSICTGAGASVMFYEKMENNVFVTGEAKWHEFIYAKENNVSLITLGHYMENYFIHDIKEKIKKTFSDDVEVLEFDINNAWLTK